MFEFVVRTLRVSKCFRMKSIHRFTTVKKKDGGAIELNEKVDLSVTDYDPFAHRKVEHPTT